jgi:CrcB protein
MSLVLGIDSAKLLNWSITRIQQGRANRGLDTLQWASPDNLWRRKFGLVFFLCVSSSLWVSAIVLTIIDTTSIVRRRLWLACVVAPPGVWARWLLARLNGQGIGSKHYFKWIPLGTLLTNMIACTLEAILAVIQIAVFFAHSLLFCLSAYFQCVHDLKDQFSPSVGPNCVTLQ